MQDIFFSDPTARAVCWMLIHSLWQGILIAALAGLIIFCTRKLPVAIRYNLLAADLFLFVALAIMTFGYELRQDDTIRGVASAPVVAGSVTAVSGGAASLAAKPDAGIQLRDGADLLRSVGNYLNMHAGLITGAWLVCLSLQLLRLSSGLYQIRRLRRKGDKATGGFWVARLSVLARQLGIRRPVSLLQSAGVRTPAAIGWWKPAIFVPLGMLAQLPADQVESILLHELAHIKRNDYITNLALHLIEALFFFNPGLRWVGALLRREREACCDDIVLAGVPDRNSYLEALLGFMQWIVDEKRTGAAALVPQLGGGKTDLLWRVRRMLNQENKKLQPAEKLILSFGLMMLLSVSLLSMHRAPQPVRTFERQPVHVVGSAAARVAARPEISRPSDTIPAAQERTERQKITIDHLTIHSDNGGGILRYHAIATGKDGMRYEVRRKGGEVTEFRINDRLIPASDYGRYTGILESIEKERKEITKPPTPPTLDALIPEAPVPDAPVPDAPVRDVPVPDALVAPNLFPPTLVPPATDSALWRLSNPHHPPLSGDKNDVGEHQPTPEDPMVWSKYRNPYVEKILRDLVRDGLIGNLNHLSFTLNADKLIVNGTRQPDNIFRAYRQKYIGAPTDHTIYSQEYTPHSSGTHCECVHEPEMPAPVI